MNKIPGYKSGPILVELELWNGDHRVKWCGEVVAIDIVPMHHEYEAKVAVVLCSGVVRVASHREVTVIDRARYEVLVRNWKRRRAARKNRRAR